MMGHNNECIQIVAPLVVQSHNPSSSAPSLAFAGAPFLGLNLRGLVCVLSTGQVAIIHDHDQSTLHLMSVLSPEPLDGMDTAFVRNYLDLNDSAAIQPTGNAR